jgi:hydroxyacylglutathione hydrolase
MHYNATHVFVGDTLFAGRVGRTDFPMSDPDLAEASLRRLIDHQNGIQASLSSHSSDSVASQTRNNSWAT